MQEKKASEMSKASEMPMEPKELLRRAKQALHRVFYRVRSDNPLVPVLPYMAPLANMVSFAYTKQPLVAAISRTGRLYFGSRFPEFWARAKDRYPQEVVLATLVAHEVGHLLLDNWERLRLWAEANPEVVRKLGMPKVAELANIAGDLVIDQILRDLGFPIDPDLYLLPETYDPPLPPWRSFEEYMALLIERLVFAGSEEAGEDEKERNDEEEGDEGEAPQDGEEEGEGEDEGKGEGKGAGEEGEKGEEGEEGEEEGEDGEAEEEEGGKAKGEGKGEGKGEAKGEAKGKEKGEGEGEDGEGESPSVRGRAPEEGQTSPSSEGQGQEGSAPAPQNLLGDMLPLGEEPTPEEVLGEDEEESEGEGKDGEGQEDEGQGEGRSPVEVPLAEDRTGRRGQLLSAVRRTVAKALPPSPQAGRGLGYLRSLLDKEFAPPPSPITWQEVLRRTVRRAMGRKGRFAKRTARSYPHPHQGAHQGLLRTFARLNEAVLKAHRRPRMPNVTLVWDTSGSTYYQKHQALVRDEVLKILKEVGEATLYQVDDQVQSAGRVRYGAGLDEVKGGGGTDMRLGIAMAERDRADLCVVLTDGYTPWPSTPPQVPVVVVLIGREGEVARIPTPPWAHRVEVPIQ